MGEEHEGEVWGGDAVVMRGKLAPVTLMIVISYT